MSFTLRTAYRLAALLLLLSTAQGASAQEALLRPVGGAMPGALKASLGGSASAKRLLSPAERKVSSHLRGTVAELAMRGPSRAAVARTKPAGLSDSSRRVDSSGRIQVYVEYKGDPAAVVAGIAKAGGTVDLVSREMGVVQCWLPYDQVSAVAADAKVRLVRLPSYALMRTGSLNSEGDAMHRADQVRALGYAGAGKKVGLISDGIAGIADSQISGDIPATYEALSARDDGDLYAGGEGTAMMEIVHDLAPGAALAFSNPNTSAEMVQAIDILDSTFNCDVIADDIGFSDEPWFEDGPIVTRINQAVANGKLYASAAGNSGGNAWFEGDYTGMAQTIAGLPMDVNNFGSGDWNIRIRIGPGGTAYYLLQWNDPWDASGNDYDMYVTDATGATVITYSYDTQDGDDHPFEAVGLFNPGSSAVDAYLVISKFSGENRHLKLDTWGYGYLMEHWSSAGSIWGHPAADSVISCGAADQATPNAREWFSSCGPVRMGVYPNVEMRNKPDITGADGVTVTGNSWYAPPFYGTSAAAPHVAALLAQLWSCTPTASNTTIRNRLLQSAVDLGAAGWDAETGWGRADALDALPTPFLAFTAQPTTTYQMAPVSPAVAVSVVDDAGNRIAGRSDSITLSLASSPAGAPLYGTTTASAVDGVALFPSLFLSRLGNYRLWAASGTLPVATSSTFSVVSRAPASLRFISAPAGGSAGAALPAFQVEVLDAHGQRVTTGTHAIRLGLYRNPGRAVLTGATASTVNGVATFDNVKISKAGAGYVLSATATRLSGATTLPFGIVP